MRLWSSRRVFQALFGMFVVDPLRPRSAYEAAVLIDASAAATQLCLTRLVDAGWAVCREHSGGTRGPKRYGYQPTPKGLEGMRRGLSTGDYTPPEGPVGGRPLRHR